MLKKFHFISNTFTSFFLLGKKKKGINELVTFIKLTLAPFLIHISDIMTNSNKKTTEFLNVV
jgi:hypothetical protein